MAHAAQLAEVARHAVRRRRNDGQGGRRSDRQQIPDPGFRGRRNRAGPCQSSTRCRTAPSRSATPRRTTTSARIRPSPSALRSPFGPNAAAEPGLVDAGRRQGSAQRVLQEVQLHGACSPATPAVRWAAGSARRSIPSTISKASRCASAASPDACCRSSAACRSRSPAATSIRRWRKARSTPPNGSVPTTTRSSASTRSRRTTTIPAGGKAARCCSPSSISTSGTRCRRHIRAVLEQAGHYANTWMMAKYDQLNPQALKRLLAGGTKLHVLLAADHGGRLQGDHGTARRNRQGERELQEGERLR